MFKTTRISTLLTWGFGLVIALIIGMSLIVFIESGSVSRDANYLVEDVNPKAAAAATVRRNILRNWANTLLIMQVKDAGEVRRITEEMAENSKVISEKLDFIEKNAKQEKGRALVAEIMKSRQAYTEDRKKYLDMVKSGDTEKASQYLYSTLNKDIKVYTDAVGQFFDFQTEKLNHTSGDIQSQALLLKSSVISIALIATIISLAAAYVVSSAVRDILGGDAHYANKIVKEIAEGNLAVEVVAQENNPNSLLYSMKTMRDKLHDTVVSIQKSAESVGIAAEQLAQTSSAVAAASAQQSEATSATAAAVEEMTVGIDSISSNAHSAKISSQEASKLSQEGGEVIYGATEEMENIAVSVESSSAIISGLEKQSDEISTIVGVIKDIADQTNLLALNAAIEAARAGETGRGFAVVADEVRKLAERTTLSTQQVAQTVEEIQKGTKSAVDSMMTGVGQVRSGTLLARQAGESIREIQSGAENVVLVVSDISNSLSEQSKASAEIARNIENIAQMVEENNSSSEQAAAAALQLQKLAEELSSSVSSFRV